jgi:hypothetical protein
MLQKDRQHGGLIQHRFCADNKYSAMTDHCVFPGIQHKGPVLARNNDGNAADGVAGKPEVPSNRHNNDNGNTDCSNSM